MDTLEAQDRWQQIENQTRILLEQSAHLHAEEMAALLTQRQHNIEVYFQHIEYTPDIADDMTEKIQRLLKHDAVLVDACREQQKNVLLEQRKLNQAKQAIGAYQAESLSEES